MMKANSFGQASCRRIMPDRTSATRPTRIAMTEYWIAMTLWSWLQTYFATKLWGS